MVAFIGPEAEDWMHGAFPSIARACSMLVGASPGADNVKIEIVPKSDASVSSIDPQLKQNLEGFLQWIKEIFQSYQALYGRYYTPDKGTAECSRIRKRSYYDG